MENKALQSNGQGAGALSGQVLAKGLIVLEGCFPNLKLSKQQLDIWATMLSDLTEEQFITGMKKFCLEHKEIFPNTNVVAYIRDYGIGRKDPRDL